MERQRQRDTKPELALRSELWRRGLRYRVDTGILGRCRRADIVFTRSRVAVFVDGCFWHGCGDHGSLPKSNREWWGMKLAANVARDAAANDDLSRAGWLVIRVWEHESVTSAADAIEAAVRSRSSRSDPGNV